MMPEELNNALQSAALTYVREVKQQGVPLRVNQELAVDIIRTKQYRHRDEISLILEARDLVLALPFQLCCCTLLSLERVSLVCARPVFYRREMQQVRARRSVLVLSDSEQLFIFRSCAVKWFWVRPRG